MSQPESPPAGNYDHLFKILLVGESGVGKSCVVLRLVDEAFDDHQLATIGVDFRVKFMNLRGKQVKLAVWDTAGQERFRTLTSSYYKGAHGIILIYDVSDRESFESVTTWLDEVKRYSTNIDAVLMLVANKIDKYNDGKPQDYVTKEQGADFAFENSMLFLETSAKTNVGIQQAFRELVMQILDTPSLLKGTASRGVGRVVIDDTNAVPGTGGGCFC